MADSEARREEGGLHAWLWSFDHGSSYIGIGQRLRQWPSYPV